MSAVINTSNLHVGGGVQVASSFIYELAFQAQAKEFALLLSTEVHENLLATGCPLSAFKSCKVFNVHGLSTLWSGLSRELAPYDVVFTVFGPLYVVRQRFRSLVGFAQGWIIYPHNEEARRLGTLQYAVSRAKFLLQAWFFKRADHLVVEAAHVKSKLCEKGIGAPSRISVVPNCISSVFLDQTLWGSLPALHMFGRFAIGFVGRDYPHKNLGLLPAVKNILAREYEVDVDLFVTLNPQEWAARSSEFKDAVHNVGVLSVAQCPTFYQRMDAVIFPSLLECFSVTPLEAMVMEKPLFASDRDFVRDICAEHAFYFDPLSPASIAATIVGYLKTCGGNDAERLLAAKHHAIQFSNAASRAKQYVDIALSQTGALARQP